MTNGWSWYHRSQSHLITDQTSLCLQNHTNNGGRCVVSWSFGPTQSSVPPRQRRNLQDWREILRRSTFRATTPLLQYFKGYLKFFAIFQNLYLFIPRFLAKPLLEKMCSVCRSSCFCSYLEDLWFIGAEWTALEYTACSWHAQRLALLHGRKT